MTAGQPDPAQEAMPRSPAQPDPTQPVVCVLGVFDGFHRGHQFLVSAAEAEAQSLGLPCLVVTFDRDPDELFLAPPDCHKLLSNSERLRLLSADGQRQLLALTFDQTLAGLEAEDFLEHLLICRCRPVGLHVGEDFRFGRQASGDVALLTAWGAKVGCSVHAHALLDDGGQAVTARRIRSDLAAARLAEANHLLTRPHHLEGPVVRGRGMGKGLGFPTANIAPADGVMLPAAGVYAGRARLVGSGKAYPAAISVGVPLTFAQAEEGLAPTLEATLLDYQGDLYGRLLRLEFLEYLRPMQGFASPELLRAQIAADVQRTRQVAAD